MYCGKCGTNHPDNYSYCSHCGFKMQSWSEFHSESILKVDNERTTLIDSEPVDTSEIKDTLLLLIDHYGIITIAIGEYYTQIYTIEDTTVTFMEAVSHYNLPGLPDLQDKFNLIGFGIAEGENYSKEIELNNSTIDQIISELKEIFEKMYGVQFYNFEISKEVSHEKASAKKNNRLLLILIGLALVLVFPGMCNNDGGYSTSSTPVVHNSAMTSKVTQVVNYLKQHLRDPESYDPIE